MKKRYILFIWAAALFVSCEEKVQECDSLSFAGSFADVNGVFYCPTSVTGAFVQGEVNEQIFEEFSFRFSTETETSCLEGNCTVLGITVRAPYPNATGVQLPEHFSGNLNQLTELGLILTLSQVITTSRPEVMALDPYIHAEDFHLEFNLTRSTGRANNCKISGDVLYGKSDKVAHWESSMAEF